MDAIFEKLVEKWPCTCMCAATMHKPNGCGRCQLAAAIKEARKHRKKCDWPADWCISNHILGRAK